MRLSKYVMESDQKPTLALSHTPDKLKRPRLQPRPGARTMLRRNVERASSVPTPGNEDDWTKALVLKYVPESRLACLHIHHDLVGIFHGPFLDPWLNVLVYHQLKHFANFTGATND